MHRAWPHDAEARRAVCPGAGGAFRCPKFQERPDAPASPGVSEPTATASPSPSARLPCRTASRVPQLPFNRPGDNPFALPRHPLPGERRRRRDSRRQDADERARVDAPGAGGHAQGRRRRRRDALGLGRRTSGLCRSTLCRWRLTDSLPPWTSAGPAKGPPKKKAPAIDETFFKRRAWPPCHACRQSSQSP